MTPPARRDGTPDRSSSPRPHRGRGSGTKKPSTHRGGGAPRDTGSKRPNDKAHVFVPNAKPARRQHVSQERARAASSDPFVGDGVRLQKVLAQAGVASRRVAEQLIEQGRVEVNGNIVTTQGLRINPDTAIVRVDGARIKLNDDLCYFVLNKPRGLQSTMSDDMGRPCVGDIVGEKIASGQRLFHVGRLDAATEGLLLITNDGELANRLMHPRYEVRKTYLATVIGEADRALMNTLTGGIELDDGPARADEVSIIDVYQGKSLVKVVLHEGRKHIVRRMLKTAGFPVERLVRTKIHTVQLGEQTPGTLRALNRSELASLYKAVGM